MLVKLKSGHLGLLKKLQVPISLHGFIFTVYRVRVLDIHVFSIINPVALRKAKIAYNFGLSECNRVKCRMN